MEELKAALLSGPRASIDVMDGAYTLRKDERPLNMYEVTSLRLRCIVVKDGTLIYSRFVPYESNPSAETIADGA
jgi:hypothetical protein